MAIQPYLRGVTTEPPMMRCLFTAPQAEEEILDNNIRCIKVIKYKKVKGIQEDLIVLVGCKGIINFGK